MGLGAGFAAAELDCRSIRAGRIRNPILPARSSRGRADDRGVRGGLPPIHGANVAYCARNLLTEQVVRFSSEPGQQGRKKPAPRLIRGWEPGSERMMLQQKARAG